MPARSSRLEAERERLGALAALPAVRAMPAGVIEELGGLAMEALVRLLYAELQASPLGRRLPGAMEARESLIQRALAELKRGGKTGEAAADSAFLVGMRGGSDPHARALWLACLKRALRALRLPTSANRALWAWFEPLSLRMVNHSLLKVAQVRYPYAAVAAELAA